MAKPDVAITEFNCIASIFLEKEEKSTINVRVLDTSAKI
jgi:hypothetical protein